MQRSAPAFALILIVFFAAGSLVAQPLRTDFRQAANDDSPYITGEIHWTQSILQRNNSIYYEGMSVPQRIFFMNIPSTQGDVHTLKFSHRATKSGKHAYDFLTSYDQAVKAAIAIVGPTVMHTLNPCGDEIGPPKNMGAICAQVRGMFSRSVELPWKMGSILGHDVEASAKAYEQRFGKRELMLYGDANITSASITFDGYTSGADPLAQYTLTWTSSSASVLIEIASHLAMSIDVTGAGTGIGYGAGLGAGSIKGGSYHFMLDRLDNQSLGNQDNQISSAAVMQSITCSTIGPDVVCANTQNSYTFNTTLTGLSYTWSLSNNTSGASIVTSPTGSTVTVDAGNLPGSYTLTVIVRDGVQTVSCPIQVSVNGFAVSAVAQPILCNGNRTPVIVTASGGTPPYSGTGTFLKHAGMHTFTVTDANGCSNSATITVSEPSELIASAVTNAALICSNSTAEVTVSAVGGKPPYRGTGKFQRGPGTHHFSVYDANNCVSYATLTVASAPTLNVTAVTSAAISCAGGTGQVTVSAAGGTPPYTGTGTFTLSAGTHQFTVTDAMGCSETTSFTLAEPPAMQVAALITSQISCYGGSGTVVVSASGGTPPYSGTGTQTLTAGTHTLTVTDANGCSASATVTLTEPSSALNVSAAVTSAISCNGGNATVSVTASGGTAPYTGTGTFSKSAGTHTFTVTDANGCSESTTLTITQPANALAVAATVTSAISCHGGSGTIDVTASGGTPPYNGTGTFNNTAGTYTFTVTDANNCTASATVTLTEPAAAISVNAAITSQINCHGGTGTVEVTASGGTPPYTGTGTFSKTAGTHTFTVTDANGCSASASVTLTEPATAMNISAAITSQINCHGGTGTVQVSATGGTPPYTGTGTFTLTAGTHTFTVTDAKGCTASTSLTLTEPASVMSVSAAVTSAINCNGGTATVDVTASGGTPPYTGTGTFTLSAGTHTFTVTDANGCSESTTLTITQPAQALAVAAAVTSAINCHGGTGTIEVTASGGTPPYTGTGTFSKTAGTYTFTVTDAKGCSASASATLTEPATALNISAAITSQINCYGGSGTVTVSASGGTPPYAGTGTFTLSAGTHTFTVTDANGCSASTSVTLTQPAASLTASATATLILCNGGTSTITVSATGGTPPYTGTGTFTEGAGSYMYTVTDAKGCSANATVNVNEPPALTVNLTAPLILCNGGSSNVTVNASGGTPPYSGTGSFTKGPGTYTFSVTDANGCMDSATVTLTEPPALTITATTTSILCNGDSATVTVSASGGTPPYYGVGTFSKSAGTHTLTVTDDNGCSASTTVSIAEPPPLTMTASATPISCHGDSSVVTVTASGGTSPYTGTGTFMRGGGTFTFVVTDANGCSKAQALTIVNPPTLVADISAAPILCNGGTTTITVGASGGTAPYNGTGTFTEGAGTYTYIVSDVNGCSDTVSITLQEPPLLVAASTFTPILCNGGSSTVTVTAHGGTPVYTGTGTFTVSAGSHTFTVTDANGCTATTTVNIPQPPALSAVATASSVSCGKDSTLVTVTATGGTSPYTGTGSFYRGLGTHTFEVEDANGCKVSTQVTITGPPALYASANATPILCHGGTSTVDVTAWGGTPPYNGVGTFTVGAGTYTYVVSDANSCTDTVVVTIIEPPALVAAVTGGPIPCNGGIATLTVTASGGTPPYSGIGSFDRSAGTHTFVIVDGNGCTDSVSITLIDPPPLSVTATATPILCHGDVSTVTVTASGGTAPYTGTGTFIKYAGTYIFPVTDARGCTEYATITITEPPELVAMANTPTVLCGKNSGDIVITAMGGTQPYTGTGTFSRTPGTYEFIVVDANGCRDTVQATVAGPPALYAAVNATPILCHGGTSTVTITAYGGTPPYSGVGTFTYGAGTHTFTVVDANQCMDTVTINIYEPPPLTVVCTLGPCVNGVRTITATVSGGTPPYTYNWMPFASPDPFVDVDCSFNGLVTLLVRDANWTSSDPNNAACEASCSINVFSKGAAEQNSQPGVNEYALYENYPNPFNPTTTIRYFLPEESVVELSVINTLGRTVATVVDEVLPAGMHYAIWNATESFGSQMPSGSYIYRIHAKSRESNREFVRERLMMLLR
ncbi:hypothetical protein KQI65_16320 [bacterium]|nr:hypothetical protein [bacterium]